MNRSRIVFLFLSAPSLALVVIAASCSDTGNDKPAKHSTRYYQAKEGGTDGATSTSVSTTSVPEAGLPDADFEMPKELSGPGQALQVLVTSYDLELNELAAGSSNMNTPAFKAYLNDLTNGLKASRARVKALAATKKVTLARSNMTERMKFESQAALQHLNYIFPNMWADTFLTRRIDAAQNLSRTIDQDIAPILGDDQDYQAELQTTRDELDKRVNRAEAVKRGVNSGPASSEGMFDVPYEDPAGPVAREPDPPPTPPADAGAGDGGKR